MLPAVDSHPKVIRLTQITIRMGKTMDKLFDGIGKISKKLHPHRGWILAGFLLYAIMLKFLEGQFTSRLQVSSLSMYFYDASAWRDLVDSIRCAGLFGVFRAFTHLDLLFFLSYGLLLLSIADRYKKKVWRVAFVVFAGLIVVSDFFENLYLTGWLSEGNPANMPTLSRLKMAGIFAIAIMLISNTVGRTIKGIRIFFATFWYCRLSIIGLVIIAVFIGIPQGQELAVFMLEHPNDWLYLPFFNAIVMIAGVAIWYLPRYLFPENPAGDEYKFRMVFQRSEWLNHFDIDHVKARAGAIETRGAPLRDDTFMREKYNVDRMFQSAVGAADQDPDDTDTPSPTESSRPDSEEVKLRWILAMRKYVPLALASCFFLILISFFAGLSAKINPPDEGFLLVLRKGMQIGRIVLMVAVGLLLLLSVARKRTRQWLLDTIMDILQSKKFNRWVFVAFALSGTGLLLGMFLFNGINDLTLLSQIVLLVATLLLIWSAAHHAGQRSWFRDYFDNTHRAILISLGLVTIGYPIYLLFFTVSTSLGLSILILPVLFYYTLQILIAYKGNDTQDRTYYLTSFVLLFAVALIVSTRIDNNHLDVETENVGSSQASLDQLVDQFTQPFAQDSVSAKIPVFFVAANGGGTMQAYWAAQVIGHLKKSTQNRIDRHVFAMSGASGGAVGLGLSTLAWTLEDSVFVNAITNVYEHDFLSGGLAYMLGSDAWLSVAPFNVSNILNRNEWLCKKYGRVLAEEFGHRRWQEPFIDTWTPDGAWRPLYFANTTRVEDGERCMSGPVDLSAATVGHDLLHSLADEGQTLTFGEAVLLTNRFPYVNTSGKIEGQGHFVDGGYHDNSGIETLMELYRAVEPLLFRESSRYEAHFIHINFGDVAWRQYGTWDECRDSCIAPSPVNDQSELAVPLSTAAGVILGSPVYNRVQELMQTFGNHMYRLYLPGSSIFEAQHSCVGETTRQAFQSVHLELIENPLGRTISLNQQRYVKAMLGQTTLPPSQELARIGEKVNAIP